MHFRIGINLGDVIVDWDNLLGDDIDVAARQQELAKPGSNCFSDFLHNQVENKLTQYFEDLGAQQMRNIAMPVRLFKFVGDADYAVNADTLSGFGGQGAPES